MSRVFTIYKVGSIGLHSKIEAVRFTGLNGNVGGSFVERAGRLKCCVLVYCNANSVVVRRVGWRGENKWGNRERKSAERHPARQLIQRRRQMTRRNQRKRW